MGGGGGGGTQIGKNGKIDMIDWMIDLFIYFCLSDGLLIIKIFFLSFLSLVAGYINGSHSYNINHYLGPFIICGKGLPKFNGQFW
jgi:hypothetical protein